MRFSPFTPHVCLELNVNHHFEKIRFQVLTLSKNQGNSYIRKVFSKRLATFVASLFLSSKIPCKIVLKIVKMLKIAMQEFVQVTVPALVIKGTE